jgi:hypothetical protein
MTRTIEARVTLYLPVSVRVELTLDVQDGANIPIALNQWARGLKPALVKVTDTVAKHVEDVNGKDGDDSQHDPEDHDSFMLYDGVNHALENPGGIRIEVGDILS